MNITWQMDQGQGDTARPARIVIDLAPEDDPDGHLTGLLLRGRLAAFLRAYARPGDLGAPESASDAYDLLSAFGYVTNMCNSRLEAMQLAARDQWCMGWGTIAAAVELARSTVKGRIQATRERFAERGVWYDLTGVHRADPVTALEATSAAWDQDGREPYLDAADPGHRPA